MNGFKNNMSDGWLFTQELRFFENFMNNWDKDVEDCDFFDIFANGNNSSAVEAKAFLKRHFSLKELAQCQSVSVERERGEGSRGRRDEAKVVDINVHRDVDCVIQELWNTDKSCRRRCREMLTEWCGVLRRRKTRTCRRKDPMEARMDEICRVLKLDAVERDVLAYAAVRQMTCFDDTPTRSTNGRNDHALFIAMATDHPASAVTAALSAKGRLRRYEVLDEDGDFTRGNAFKAFLECGDGERNSPQSRMAGIRICNEQVPRESSMVVVDEADQLLRTSMSFFAAMFGGVGSSGSEKGVINSILDETKLPTIWISNAPACALDDSVRRRFDYSIRFDKLGSRQRLSIWRNSVKKFGLGRLVTPELAEQFAQKYQTNAGGIAMVLENVKRMRPRKDKVADLVDSLMKPHCELMEAKTKDDVLRPAKDYSLEGLNIKGDVALDRIVEAVRNFRNSKDDGGDPDRPRMNILLWGPPGTGKTEFVKHLGQTLNSKVVVKMGSDLLSMWVGGTETNIKQAFEEAEADNAILFLDEIDGIVQDRSGAQRSWEVTQVNELLHRMENFKGVMVGATNFIDNLDAAIMRRFTFKLQFDYLDAEGKRAFFERMFKTRLAEAEAARLAAIPSLAPGDFRTVRQSLYYLGGLVTNATRLGELEKESSLKKGNSCRVGF